jgi:hypothetical protein
MEERTNVIGYLASDGVLFCSRACAVKEGRRTGCEVDPDEYESLVESGSVQAGSLCPACGADFGVLWPEREHR